MSASLIQPQVRKMLEASGVYITGDTKHPEALVILVSLGGKIYSTRLDNELAPDRFLDTLVIKHGPLK